MSFEKVSKCMLMFTGLCYLACAGTLLYIGVWVFSTYDHFDELADSSLTLLPASIVLGISIFMCIIGVLSCVAAFKNNRCLLSVFFCLILAVFIGEICAGALCYVYRSKVENVLHTDMMEAVNEYNVTVNKEQIDYMQEKFHCCGVNNASDWMTSTSWHPEHPKTVPESCCQHNSTCNAIIDDKVIYTKGCLHKLKDEFSENLIYISVSVVVMALIQLLALICTCVLVCRTREQVPYMSFGEQVGGGLRV